MRILARRLLRLGSFLLIAICAGATASAAPSPASHNISGVWWIEHFDPRLVPMDGSPVPYNDAGKIAHDRNVAAIAAGTLDDPAIDHCLLTGLPRAMLSAYPLKIVQHDSSVTFIHEQNHMFWHAIMDIPHHGADDVEPAFMGGDSIARWDGDTLVVDSISFKPAYLDDQGMPHSDALHVTQRLRKIDHNMRLEALITIEDPGVFSKPWVARRTYAWRSDVVIMEYVCGDPKRVLTGDGAKAVRLRRRTP